MRKNILVLEEMYRQQQIHYLIHGDTDEMMYNATEMAKIFDKKVSHFLDNTTTEEYIKVCCADSNFHEIFGFGTTLVQQGNYFGGRNSARQNQILTFQERKKCLVEVKSGGRDAGTWMQETIALDFAAWLDPNFKFWMNRQIRKITVGYYADHRKANINLNEARGREELFRSKIRIDPSLENYQGLVKAMDDIEIYSKAKTKAIRNQTKMDL